MQHDYYKIGDAYSDDDTEGDPMTDPGSYDPFDETGDTGGGSTTSPVSNTPAPSGNVLPSWLTDILPVVDPLLNPAAKPAVTNYPVANTGLAVTAPAPAAQSIGGLPWYVWALVIGGGVLILKSNKK